MTAAGAKLVVVADDPSPDRVAQLLAPDVARCVSYDARPGEIVAGIPGVHNRSQSVARAHALGMV